MYHSLSPPWPQESIISRYFKAPAKAHCSCSNRASWFWSAFSISDTVSSWWHRSWRRLAEKRRVKKYGEIWMCQSFTRNRGKTYLWNLGKCTMSMLPLWIQLWSGLCSQPLWLCFPYLVGQHSGVRAKPNVRPCLNGTPKQGSAFANRMKQNTGYSQSFWL